MKDDKYFDNQYTIIYTSLIEQGSKQIYIENEGSRHQNQRYNQSIQC